MPAGVKNEGQWNKSFIHVSDIMPTVLALTWATYPKEVKGKPVKQPIGNSLLPLLKGETTEVHSDVGMGWELFERKAYIKGNWKILRLAKPFGTGNWQLYNIEKDPGETTDLSLQLPAKRDSLINDWMRYAKENTVVDHKGYYDALFEKSLTGKHWVYSFATRLRSKSEPDFKKLSIKLTEISAFNNCYRKFTIQWCIGADRIVSGSVPGNGGVIRNHQFLVPAKRYEFCFIKENFKITIIWLFHSLKVNPDRNSILTKQNFLQDSFGFSIWLARHRSSAGKIWFENLVRKLDSTISARQFCLTVLPGNFAKLERKSRKGFQFP